MGPVLDGNGIIPRIIQCIPCDDREGGVLAQNDPRIVLLDGVSLDQIVIRAFPVGIYSCSPVVQYPVSEDGAVVHLILVDPIVLVPGDVVGGEIAP